MKRLITSILLLLVLHCCNNVSAQGFSIKGMLGDTLNANKLQNGSVVLMRAADSVLVTFTRSKTDGSFVLKPTKPDIYLFMASFPGFADYVDIVTVSKEKPVVEMGTIPMVTKSHLLAEFVLKQQIGSIKIKGDTTEYLADSFKVRDNATVEELLKKLPGIQVNKNGEVVAQGETVQKILVDGEEFFSDDPAVVTKNLQAKAVDKVQVFDKKSDQSIFTGVDDGTREKTINLQLKDNMKSGYFGKIVAGGGTDEFFENQVMLNAFKGKRKFSVFGIASNTGKVGLGWKDKDKFGGGDGSEVQMSDDGFMMTTYTDDGSDLQSWSGNYNGQGLPTAWTGGLHYSNKWLNDKLHLSSNYRLAQQNLETTNNTLTETSLGIGDGGKQYSTQKSNTFNSGQRQRGDFILEYKIDSTSELKMTGNIGYSNSQSYTQSDNATSRDTFKLNSNARESTNDATAKSANATLVWKKKFAKKGRTIFWNVDEKYQESYGTGINISYINYYNPLSVSLVDSVKKIDQRKETNSQRLSLTSKLSYTEPLSKKLFLELEYGASVNNSSSDKLTKDKDTSTQEYNTNLNNKYSSKYDFNVLTNTGGANLRYVYKAYNISFGGAMSNTQFYQNDRLLHVDTNNRNYTNFFPKAAFNYRVPGRQQNIRINYSGSTQQPSIEQIQPLQQNTDPLNISIGNPSLKQEFDHNINLGYNSFKVLTGSYTYLGGGMTFVQDDISRAETISSGGQRTYQYINVNGNYNGYVYSGYGFELKKLDLRINFNLNANVSKVNNYINGVKNTSENNSFTIGTEINYDKEKKFNLSYSPSVSLNHNTATINATTTDYFSYNQQLDGNVTLPYHFEIGSNVDWVIRQKMTAYDINNTMFLWNAYVSKKMLKNDQLELRVYANDILNQNINFSRYGTGNVVTQQSYNTIRRYCLIQFIWNFSKAAATTPSPVEGGTKIIIKN